MKNSFLLFSILFGILTGLFWNGYLIKILELSSSLGVKYLLTSFAVCISCLKIGFSNDLDVSDIFSIFLIIMKIIKSAILFYFIFMVLYFIIWTSQNALNLIDFFYFIYYNDGFSTIMQDIKEIPLEISDISIFCGIILIILMLILSFFIVIFSMNKLSNNQDKDYMLILSFAVVLIIPVFRKLNYLILTIGIDYGYDVLAGILFINSIYKLINNKRKQNDNHI